ncbi:YcjX family protein [Gallaecimonas sp. GXIMD4217]|uniref:YcjX family protein n=1 Tax=Gallaecimonas sp. GXIMD4217 TaxID=3131927 RepID=UPI00311AE0B2
MSLLSHPKVRKLAAQTSDALKRTLDQNVRLAVTGLSQAGKTAFITSLVDQLLHGGQPVHQPFFSVVAEERYLGARLAAQPHPELPRFRYREAMAGLTGPEPAWPPSTQGISELRLDLRYQAAGGLRGLWGEPTTLTLDIVDYPGEWLLDLALLEQDYEQWSRQQLALLQSEPRAALAADWLAQAGALEADDQADEVQVEALAGHYAELLGRFRHELGLSFLQPGRFLLPGELKGAPVLAFFPWPGEPPEQPGEGSLYQLLKRRFEQYQETVVRGFYRKHFAQIDRQVVLVDCLQSLNHSRAAFEDLQLALQEILRSFHYGRTNVLRRLFSPRIDKVLFAATQADRLTPDQRPALSSLISQLIGPAREQVRYEGIDTQVDTLAAICATQSGLAEHDGQQLPCLRGRLDSGKAVTLFPGDVPHNLPQADFWSRQGFEFHRFAPPLELQSPLPQVRMDKALEYLLGDKLS